MRKLLVSCVVALLLLSGIVYAGGSQEAETPEVKDTLIIAVGYDSSDQNPHGKNSTSLSRVKAQVYETLFLLTYENELKPWLATGYKWENDVTLVINLRKGVKFHNGEEMKASDVLFSLECVQDSANSMTVDKIDFAKSSVVDDYTVKLVTKEPYSPLLTNLSYLPTAIFSEKGYKEVDGDFFKADLGTGPFIWGEWVPGSSQELFAYDGYWGQHAGVNKVEFHVIAESAVRVIELETGGCDIAYDVSANDIDRIEDSEDMVMSRWSSNDTIILGFNCSEPPFNDYRVRKAVSMAFDRKAIWQVSYNGTGALPVGFIEKSTRGAVSDIPLSTLDIEGAKALLAEAGYPNGFSTSIVNNTTSERMAISEYLQNALKKINIDLHIDALDAASTSDKIKTTTDFGMYTWSIWPATGDIDYALRSFYGDTPPSLNIERYSNPKFDALIDQAAGELDDAKRFALQRQAQEILFEEYPVIPLVVRERLYSHTPDVVGFAEGSSQTPLLYTVSFK